jgi:hypothetical protein
MIANATSRRGASVATTAIRRGKVDANDAGCEVRYGSPLRIKDLASHVYRLATARQPADMRVNAHIARVWKAAHWWVARSSTHRCGPDFVSLTKPDVSLLIGLTTTAGYCLGARAQERTLAAAGPTHTVVGTVLVASGTATMNQLMEQGQGHQGALEPTARRGQARNRYNGVVQGRTACVCADADSLAWKRFVDLPARLINGLTFA